MLLPLQVKEAETQSALREALELRRGKEEEVAKAIDGRKAAEDAALKAAQDTEGQLAILRKEGIEKEIEIINQGYAELIAQQIEIFGKESQEAKNALELRDIALAAARKKYADDATAAYMDLSAEIADAVAVETEAARALELERLGDYYAELIAREGVSGYDKLELKKAQLLAEQQLKQQFIDEDAAIKKEADDKEKQDAQDTADEKQANLNAGFDMAFAAGDAIQALNEAFAGEDEASQKKAFEANKKVQLAQAVIATIQGTQNAFVSAQASPFTKIFPAYPFIQAGIAGAFGLANLKKIQSSTFQSTTAPAGGGGGGGSAPAMNGASSNSLGGPNTGTGGRNFRSDINAPVATKTYVLAGDVTTAQQAEDKINQRRVF